MLDKKSAVSETEPTITACILAESTCVTPLVSRTALLSISNWPLAVLPPLILITDIRKQSNEVRNFGNEGHLWSYRVLEGTLKLPNDPDFNEAFGETALMYREVEVLCFQYKKRKKTNKL